MNPVFVLVVAIAISMLVIPLMWRLAPALGMIDRPDERKVHRAPIPRIGGWGIVLGALIPVAMVEDMTPMMQAFIGGGLILFAFGAWDDRTNANHWTKFIGQIAAAALVVYHGDVYVHRFPCVGFDTVPEWFGRAFTVFAIVGAINATNHSDGLDGLAGGESLLSLIVIGLLIWVADPSAPAVIVCAAALGGILGFLRFNTHPARVFMGDTGSQFLGYTLAFLVVHLTQDVNGALSPALPALLLGLPIVDILAVLYLRIKGGMNWFKATKNHIHHRLLDLGFDHYEVVVLIYSIQALLVVSAFFMRFESDWLILGWYLAVVVALFGGLIWAERTGWRAHTAGRTSRLSGVMDKVVAHPGFTRIPLLVIALTVPLFMVVGSLGVEGVPRDFGIVAAVLFVMLVGEMIIGKEIGTVLMRGAVYVAAVFIVYLSEHARPLWWFQFEALEIALYVLLAIAIGITVRYVQERRFNTSPMDYLIVFGVLTIALFAGRLLEVQQTGIIIVKAMVVLYGCEILITRMTRKWNLLNVSAAVALGALGVRGLMMI